MASSWTSLQIATLAVDALTPLTVAGLGIFIARASRRIEQVQWANQTVVTRRLDIFGQLAPGLNQLLCFATFVSGWKEIQPKQAIAIKRQLDETMYASKVLFSDQLFAAYHQFMTTLFAMYATTDADAHLRAPIESKWGNRRNMAWWEDSMTSLFSPDTSSAPTTSSRPRPASAAIPRRTVRHPPDTASLGHPALDSHPPRARSPQCSTTRNGVGNASARLDGPPNPTTARSGAGAHLNGATDRAALGLMHRTDAICRARHPRIHDPSARVPQGRLRAIQR